ncbi:HNH endonuclease signature motif containing protein [Brucella rhizosphaerae]|uniref:HNH endonuclease signature motif containing protein n=1 Tax=Brucella rhizosphaerae TaxID=571254 RepID=UPI003D766DA2
MLANPYCTADGCEAPATEADHIKSIKEAPELRLEWSNLRALCKSCHSRRTARDQGFARSTRG